MIHGTILLDKPKNITSNRALSIVKRKLSIKKAGIVGILDPLASGMLPIVLNEGTKLAKYIEPYEKEYQAVAKLGSISTTGDGEGEIIIIIIIAGAIITIFWGGGKKGEFHS